MKSAWNKYFESLSAAEISSLAYNYPVSDKRTDQNLAEQSPGTRGNEQRLFIEWLRKPWEVALDFGCGTGANFYCFDQSRNKNGLLIGLEPDTKRAEQARKKAAGCRYIETAVFNDGITFLEKIPENLEFDRILCSQVLGHVSGPDLKRILKAFTDRLPPGGQCALAVPVVGESYGAIAGDSDWQPGEDFLHLVDFNAHHSDEGYRRQVTEEKFNASAENPPPNYLPVRCFWMPDFPLADHSRLPIEASRPPSTLEDMVGPYFDMTDIWIYSIHEKDSRNQPVAIGDVLIIMNRR